MELKLRNTWYCAGPLAALILAVLAGCGGNSSQQATAAAPNQLHASVTSTAATAKNYTAIAQQLYLAYFGRPADPLGLENFTAALASANAPADIQQLNASGDHQLAALINSFGTSAESAALYSGDNTAFVVAIYRNALNRMPDDEGLAFWVKSLEDGRLTRPRAAVSIMAGALSNGTAQGVLDSQLINARTTVATYFSEQLKARDANGYVGDASAAFARTLMGMVTASTDTIAFRSIVDAWIGSHFIGVNSGTPTMPMVVSAPIVLAVGNSASVGPGLSISFDGVEDSRCPIGVYCVWEGALLYKLTLHGSADEPFILTDSKRLPGLTSRFDALNDLHVELITATQPPVPVFGQPPPAYSVRLFFWGPHL